MYVCVEIISLVGTLYLEYMCSLHLGMSVPSMNVWWYTFMMYVHVCRMCDESFRISIHEMCT
jgi:uncharacterized membrane protein YfhO